MFVRHLQYIPMMAGIALACVQFFPEMYHKCLKLTLHLPCSHLRMMFEMLGFGLVALLVCFGLNYLILWLGMRPSLAPELYGKMLLVALPWYLAGFAAYLLSAWIILEGSWSRRIFNLVVEHSGSAWGVEGKITWLQRHAITYRVTGSHLENWQNLYTYVNQGGGLNEYIYHGRLKTRGRRTLSAETGYRFYGNAWVALVGTL